MMVRTTIREIRQSLGRYMAILAIVALGVGLFSGLKVTKPAMAETVKDYLDENEFYDYRLISTLGFEDGDVEAFAALDGVRAAEGSVTLDILTTDQTGNESVLRFHTLTENVNQVELLGGRMPENGTECLADAQLYDESFLGERIILTEDNTGDDLENFAEREYTVVGIVRSPYYIQFDRGTTSLGSGKISGFIYLPADGYSVDYYTEIFVKFNEDFELYSDEYDAFLEEKEVIVAALVEKQANLRYKDILTEAMEELADAREEFEEKRADAEQELLDARQELDDAAAEIADGERLIQEAEADIVKAEKEIPEKEQELRDAEETVAQEEANLQEKEQELADGVQEWKDNNWTVETAKSQLNEQQTQLDAQREALKLQEEQLNASADEIDSQEAQLNAAIAVGMMAETDESVIQARAGIEAGRIQLQAYRQELTAADETIDGYQDQIDSGKRSLAEADEELADAWQTILDGREQIADGWQQIEDAKAEIADGWVQIEDAKVTLADGKARLPEKKQELEDGKREYEDGLARYEEAYEEFNTEIADAEQEIADAEQEIADLEEPDTYVLGRDTNVGYVYFESDSDIVEGIANIFPAFFFLVAALVCITTMNRMVEEQRTQIGVLKALGYGSGPIMCKYLFYSGSAAVTGCIFGYFFGTFLFPIVIWNAYGIMYNVGSLVYVFDMRLAAISLTVSLLCSMGTTLISCRYELAEVAAELMRPKAPKAGKRVFLEYLPFIWKRLKFLRKVSLRNLFRYKKRFLMMVIGISGCTALLVTGFGIKDSIANVANQQFSEIQIYDIGVSFKNAMDEDMETDFADAVASDTSDYTMIFEKSLDLYVKGHTKSLHTVIIKDPERVGEFVNLHTAKGGTIAYPSTGEAVITHKIADNYSIRIGDEIQLRDEDMNEITVTVSGIAENFIYDYVYLNEATYEDQMKQIPEYKSAYVNLKEDTDAHRASADIMKLDEVSSVTVNQDILERFTDMMSSLNYIVIVVIICAAALAFIVLYNLTNINITERIREIATTKVLGFYKKETNSYVFRENLMLTGIGAVVGLVLGYFLHQFVMNEINIDMVAFDIHVMPLSYFYSFLLTFLFTWIVNRIMSVKLERINMAESMKSVD